MSVTSLNLGYFSSMHVPSEKYYLKSPFYKYQTVSTVAESNQKIVETEAKLISITHIHDCSLSGLVQELQ